MILNRTNHNQLYNVSHYSHSLNTQLGLIVQSIANEIVDAGVLSLFPPGLHTFVKIDDDIVLRSVSSFS